MKCTLYIKTDDLSVRLEDEACDESLTDGHTILSLIEGALLALTYAPNTVQAGMAALLEERGWTCHAPGEDRE